MRSLLRIKKPGSIGIDISSSSVKVVSLEQSGRDYILTAFARAALPQGAVVEKEIKDREQVINALKKAITLSRTSNGYGAVALADSSVMTRIISVEASLSELEFEECVMLEADKHIPYPLDEIRLDYHVLSNSTKGSATKKVFIAASRNETIDAYLDIIEGAGLIPTLVDVESFAMRKACRYFIDGFDAVKTTAVIDIGTARTSIVVYHDSMPVFTRTELFGSEFLTRDISTEMLNLSEYENKKEDDELYENFKKNAIQHMKRALQFYASTSDAKKVEKIVLSGSAALLAGLDKLVKTELGLNMVVADPVVKLGIGPKVDTNILQQFSAAIMIATGLAMRGFD